MLLLQAITSLGNFKHQRCVNLSNHVVNIFRCPCGPGHSTLKTLFYCLTFEFKWLCIPSGKKTLINISSLEDMMDNICHLSLGCSFGLLCKDWKKYRRFNGSKQGLWRRGRLVLNYYFFMSVKGARSVYCGNSCYIYITTYRAPRKYPQCFTFPIFCYVTPSYQNEINYVFLQDLTHNTS